MAGVTHATSRPIAVLVRGARSSMHLHSSCNRTAPTDQTLVETQEPESSSDPVRFTRSVRPRWVHRLLWRPPPRTWRWQGGWMGSNSRHISVRIDRPTGEVYAFASNPAKLPAWASGLGSSVEFVDGQWIAESPMGRVAVAFVPHNELGVLDHEVTLPSGETVCNPMRVIAHGAGCEVIFTLRGTTEVSDEDFEQDAAKVSSDLGALKRVLEDR